MIFKQQADFLPNMAAVQPPRLDFSQRAVLKWATIEEGDRVLDMDCGNGALLYALMDQYRLSACGLCPSAQQARANRDLLPDADVMYAMPEDIPFRSQSFDEVFITRCTSRNCRPEALNELMRVLRPGGQVIIACKGLRVLRNMVMEGDMELEKRDMMRALQQAGFKDVSWRSSGLMGVIIGWKQNTLH